MDMVQWGDQPPVSQSPPYGANTAYSACGWPSRARLWFRTLEIWIGTLGQAQLDHRAKHWHSSYTSKVLACGGQNERNGRDLEQLKAIHGLLFRGAKCKNWWRWLDRLRSLLGWKRRRRAGLRFMAQRTVCASISRLSCVHRRCEGF